MYFPFCDAIGGLCREHTEGLDTRIRSFDSAVEIAHVLAAGTVQYGKEVSVIAVTSFGDKLRNAFPIQHVKLKPQKDLLIFSIRSLLVGQNTPRRLLG